MQVSKIPPEPPSPCYNMMDIQQHEFDVLALGLKFLLGGGLFGVGQIQSGTAKRLLEEMERKK